MDFVQTRGKHLISATEWNGDSCKKHYYQSPISSNGVQYNKYIESGEGNAVACMSGDVVESADIQLGTCSTLRICIAFSMVSRENTKVKRAYWFR